MIEDGSIECGKQIVGIGVEGIVDLFRQFALEEGLIGDEPPAALTES